MPVGILEQILVEIRRGNAITEEILMKLNTVIMVRAVNANAPPQYTGPSSIGDLVVGVGRALQGFDPDGDVIRWSLTNPETDGQKVSVTPEGVLTALVPLGSSAAPSTLVAISVTLDDGKP
jgi:hypothetical protein